MKLPAYQDLDPEQDRVLNLPLDRNCLVSGPPGTGKTLVAMYRAQTLNQARRQRAFFIVYNKPLELYLKQALRTLNLGHNVKTYHSWMFGDIGKTLPGGELPTLPGKPWDVDWETLIEMLPDEVPAHLKHDHIILDEAQDFNSRMFRLVPWLASNYSIFADENQRITGENSTLAQIRQGSRAAEYRLTRNYRNTAQIHDVAVQFYTGLDTGMAQRPNRGGPLPLAYRHASFNSQVRQIVQYERTNSDLEIGVFVPWVEQLEAFRKAFADAETRNRVQYYHHQMAKGDRRQFEGPGIRLLTYKGVKGLEFDTVFLPCLEHPGANRDPDAPLNAMQFYVLITRAREEVFFLWSGAPESTEPRILGRIPGELAPRRIFGAGG